MLKGDKKDSIELNGNGLSFGGEIFLRALENFVVFEINVHLIHSSLLE